MKEENELSIADTKKEIKRQFREKKKDKVEYCNIYHKEGIIFKVPFINQRNDPALKIVEKGKE